MLRWDKQHEFLFARVIDSLAGWYSRFLSKMKQFRGQIVSVHNLVPPKYCEQNFIRDKQRCYFFSLSSPFNFCRSQTDVADKVVLPSNEELQICLVDVDIQEHLKFGMLKILVSDFLDFLPKFHVWNSIEPPLLPHRNLPHLSSACWNKRSFESISIICDRCGAWKAALPKCLCVMRCRIWKIRRGHLLWNDGLWIDRP